MMMFIKNKDDYFFNFLYKLAQKKRINTTTFSSKKMADIFFGKFSELIEPQLDEANQDKNIEQQALIKKDNSQNINKTLVYLSICVCLAIAGYYFLA